MTDNLTRTAPKRLSTLDKWLPAWIGLAMAAVARAALDAAVGGRGAGALHERRDAPGASPARAPVSARSITAVSFMFASASRAAPARPSRCANSPSFMTPTERSGSSAK